MKKLLLLTCVAAVLTNAAFASEFGLRAGLTVNPDQFHIGGHLDMGAVLPPMRLVPNIEIGFGDDETRIAMNGDLIYDFAGTPFGVGGELGLNYFDDKGGSNTELGLSALGNYRLGLSNGKTLLFEAKVGLLDSPDFKLTLGYSFF